MKDTEWVLQGHYTHAHCSGHLVLHDITPGLSARPSGVGSYGSDGCRRRYCYGYLYDHLNGSAIYVGEQRLSDV